MQRRRIILLALTILACDAKTTAPESGEHGPRPAAPADTPAPAPTSAPAPAPASTVPAPEVAPTKDARGPLEIASRTALFKPSAFRPSTEPGMTDEPHNIGWSASTGEFVYCVHDGGAVCERCRFHKPGADAIETVAVGEDCEAPVKPRELAARLKAGAFAVRDGDWRFGAEVVLLLSSTQGREDSDGLKRGVLRVGARLRAEDAAVGWFRPITRCRNDAGQERCAPDVHVDAIAPAADGETVAVLAHSFAGEYTDEYPVALHDATTLAVMAYNAEGLARLKAEQFADAATLFKRVAALDPKAWKGPYNLACAHARAGDQGAARAALEEAVRRGGDAVRKKLPRDPDLEGVRGEPWFSQL